MLPYLFMKKGVLILALLFVPLCLAVDASISCPEEVYYNEEFECQVLVSDLDSVYDLKIYFSTSSGGVNRIYEDEFRRADWYLKGYIQNEGEYDVPLIIHKEFQGVAEVQFKLRMKVEKL